MFASAHAHRTSLAAFWIGSLAVMLGVGLHIPMFLESAAMGYAMAGMPMYPSMLIGMALIVAGTLAAGYGLLPGAATPMTAGTRFSEPTRAMEGSHRPRLTIAHWQLMLTMVLALVIDTMKPASLGFVVPGMAHEYVLAKPIVALLPFFALTGTALGSLVWGYLADLMGRRAAILLAAIMFIGTSICGAMPSFTWNVVMCFLMGMSAGGMLPITYTLLAETVPAEHRGWSLVLLGGLGLAGGYLAASGCATLLEPHFGWRIMWFLGLPTGLLLILLNQFIPESPRFLSLQGRIEEARAILSRFGAAMLPDQPLASVVPHRDSSGTRLFWGPLVGTTMTLNFAALAWGLVNFGVLLWLPTDLRVEGYSVGGSDSLLAQSPLIALPTALTAWLYQCWSTKWSLVLLSFLTAVGLLGFSLLRSGIPLIENSPAALVSLLMIGSNGIIAVLLPYSAENYPSQTRGRATGLVAGSSKLGGIAAQGVSMAALVPALATAALVLAVPIAISAVMVGCYGAETRGRRLEDLDR